MMQCSCNILATQVSGPGYDTDDDLFRVACDSVERGLAVGMDERGFSHSCK